MELNVNPLVSIIIPVYNRASLIGETLQSIKAQTYFNWEAILVDDGSIDGSFDVVDKYCQNDARIRLHKREREPKGAPTCRNIGIEKSEGEFLIFLDSDDLLSEHCLSQRVDFFSKNPDEDFLVFQSVLFKKELHDYNILWNIDSQENDLDRFLRIDALWSISGPIYKRKTIIDVGGFRENLSFYQDFDLHLRLLFLKCQYKKFLTNEADCFIRHHSNNSVSNSIPFTSDKVILQKRIDFFLDQLEFVNQHKINLSKNQKETVWNVLFYFCSRFLLEHNDKKSYHNNWFKTGQLLGIGLWKQTIAYLVPVMTALQKKSKIFIKIKSLYSSYFKKYLADDTLIFNSTLMKQSIKK